MTVRIESTVLIDRPVEEVFALALDFEKAPTWDPDTDSVVKTSEGPTAAGSTFVFEQEVQGKRRKSTMRLTGIETNRKIDAEAQLGPKFSPTMSMTFHPEEGRTRVSVRGEGNPQGFLKLMSRRMERVGEQVWNRRLTNLKSFMEGMDSGSSGSIDK